MWQALDDWEKYLHDAEPQLPLLVRCALLHYQFETIHPFLDGNGRMGRLFIVLYLLDRGRLPAPLLYLSGYLDRRKGDYYDRLQAVRERGEVSDWLQFFVDGVAVQATDAVDRAEQLSDLREEYRARLRRGGRSYMAVDLLFPNPILTVKYVQDHLAVSQPGAADILRRLAAVGIVEKLGTGSGVRHRWIGTEVLEVLDPES
jgi:Fic family protein